MASVTKLLETKMKLVVNREKSKVALTAGVKSLGMTIIMGLATISAQAIDKAMEKVKEMTLRGTSKPIEKTIEEINRWYRGWSTYFEMTHYPRQFAKLEAHIRRRLRARLVHNMKRPKNIARALVKAGSTKKTANKAVYSHKSWWALSHNYAITRMYSKEWFEERGLFIKSKETHSHWCAVAERISIS